jgi:hypothetical protein
LENLEENNSFLDTYNLSKFIHEDLETLNRPLTGNKIESIIKCLQKRKAPC